MRFSWSILEGDRRSLKETGTRLHADGLPDADELSLIIQPAIKRQTWEAVWRLAIRAEVASFCHPFAVTAMP